MSEWEKVTEELPPCDGFYYVRNHPKDFIGACKYDGYGFLNYLDCYCEPLEWCEIPPRGAKRYGKVKND